MSELTPMQSFCLAAISREAPIMASVLRSDLRTLARNGAAAELDENRVFRTLEELKQMDLVTDTLGGWVLADKKPAKVQKQGSFL